MVLRAIIGILWFGTGSVFAQEAETEKATPPAPSVVQEKVREWVRAKKELGKEAADWGESKRSMVELNALRKKEIGLIDEVISAAGKRLEDVEEKKGKLEVEMAALERGRGEMEARIVGIEDKVREQVAMFPPPLRKKLADELRRLESSEADTPLQNRFRDALVILGAAGQFQNSVTVETEIREFGDERVELDVIYLGFSGAWYVDRAGKRSGRGNVGDDGWEWVEDAGIAERVQRSIAMHRKETTPGYVELPFGEKKGGAE